MQAANVKLAWGLEAEISPTRDTSQAGAGELEGEAGLGRWGGRGGGGRGQKALGQHPARTQPEIGWAHACAVHSPSIRLLRTSERRAPLGGMEEESGGLGAPIFWAAYLFGFSNFLVSAWVAR